MPEAWWPLRDRWNSLAAQSPPETQGPGAVSGSAAHLPVELHGQDGVGVAVVADLGPLLKWQTFSFLGALRLTMATKLLENNLSTMHTSSVSAERREKTNPRGCVPLPTGAGVPAHEHVSKGRLPVESSGAGGGQTPRSSSRFTRPRRGPQAAPHPERRACSSETTSSRPQASHPFHTGRT